MDFYVGMALGAVIGWIGLGWRISNVATRWLDGPHAFDVVDLLDEVFWVVVPWPLNRWIARHTERKIERKG